MSHETMLIDYTAKIYFLIDIYHLWAEDGTFTFPDGDMWELSQYREFEKTYTGKVPDDLTGL